MTGRTRQLYLTTPTLESEVLSRKTGFKVFLKLENLQPCGSFKLRGISHLCQTVVEERACTHFTCASGGNAGLATAYVAQHIGLKCTIVLFETVPPTVAEKIKNMGAAVVIHGKELKEASAYAKKLTQNPGTEQVKSDENPLVWEGHATIIAEAVQQMPSRPDVIIASIAGGGLVNGLVNGMKKVGWEDVPIIAMETEGADCFNKAIAAGKVVTLPKITSMVKCLGSRTVTEQTFKLYTEKHPEILSVVVHDKEAVNACLQFAEDHRFIVDPACGATLACLYSDVIPMLQREGRLGNVSTALLIVCGGSGVSLELLNEWKKQFNL